ncbi:hypothetical protein [Streptomyces sp. NPDC048590]
MSILFGAVLKGFLGRRHDHLAVGDSMTLSGRRYPTARLETIQTGSKELT